MAFVIQSIVLFSLVLLATAGTITKESMLFEATHKECVAATKIDDTYFEKANKGDFVDDAVFNQYLLCLAKKLGNVKESFEISEEVAKKNLETKFKDEAKVTALLKKCVVKAATAEETAYSMHKCFLAETDFKFEKLIEKHPETHKECLAKSHVEDAVIEKAKKNEDVNDEKFKQYLLCGFTKNGVIKESFEVQVDAVRKALTHKIKDEAKVEEVLNKCIINHKLETVTKTLFANTKCLFENVPEFKFVYKF